mmetsp:Transcript_9006/g.8096  ORF Transcript_9006/g.8096 Transcript_9006/m.8096 type:complete len:377 (-) Transcript_9006:1-1131(-)
MEYSYYTEMEMNPNFPLNHLQHNNKEEKTEMDESDDNINKLQCDIENNSDTSEISDGRMCRYCFCEVSQENNYSSCQCRTALCRECLEKELCLTEGRQDHKMKCTVCQFEYHIDYLNDSPPTCFKIVLFSLKETFCCSHLQIQGARIASLRERMALSLLMCFLALWTCATTYSIIDPGIDKFDGFTAELLVYLFLVFMDFCVGFSMIWFVKLVETLQLSLPMALGLLHVFRCIIVVLLRFVVMGINDAWKFAGNLGMITTSFCVISACAKLFLITAYTGYRRIQMRNVQIMVNDKGPFRLRDLDRHQRRNRSESTQSSNSVSRSRQMRELQLQREQQNLNSNGNNDINIGLHELAPQPNEAPVDEQQSDIIRIEEL